MTFHWLNLQWDTQWEYTQSQATCEMQSYLSTAPKITHRVKRERTVSTALQIMVLGLCLFPVNTAPVGTLQCYSHPSVSPEGGRGVGGEGAGSRTPLHLSQIAKCTDAQAPYIKWCSMLGPPSLSVLHLLNQLRIEFFTFNWLNPRVCNQRRFNLGIGGQTVFGNSCTFRLKL